MITIAEQFGMKDALAQLGIKAIGTIKRSDFGIGGKLQNIMVGQPLLVHIKPLYKGPKGQHFAPPRWGTIFGVLQV